jgi:hypothetical protein
MEFESWWNEEGPSRLDHPPGPGTTVRQLNAQTGHGTKHTMTIFYFTMEQLFQIHIGALSVQSHGDCDRCFPCAASDMTTVCSWLVQMIRRSRSRLPSRGPMARAWRCANPRHACNGLSWLSPPLSVHHLARLVTSAHRCGRHQPWDLYVGARLDVLGRPTTLMKASCETMTWLDRQAGLMMQRIKRLEADLAKFQPLSVRGRCRCRCCLHSAYSLSLSLKPRLRWR